MSQPAAATAHRGRATGTVAADKPSRPSVPLDDRLAEPHAVSIATMTRPRSLSGANMKPGPGIGAVPGWTLI
jgi:hypothetical protein